jgi:hypothetical protein
MYITESVPADLVMYKFWGGVLGAQRPSITNAAQELERAGLIERGRQSGRLGALLGSQIRRL